MVGIKKAVARLAGDRGPRQGRRRVALIALVGLVGASLTVLGPSSNADTTGLMKRLATGKLRPTVVQVNGVEKRVVGSLPLSRHSPKAGQRSLLLLPPPAVPESP